MDNKEEKTLTDNLMPDVNTPANIEMPEIKQEEENVEQPEQSETTQEEVNNGVSAEEQQKIETKPENRPIKNPDAFNSNEKVLYEIKEEKQGSPLVVLALFILLISFILLLPKINELVQKKFGPNYERVLVNTPNKEEQKEDETVNKFHDANNRVKIGNLDIFQVDTISMGDEYFATFTITNNGSNTYTYNKKYYLVLYEDKRPLYRALIYSKDYKYLPAYGSDELRLVINKNTYDNANNFKLEEINTNLYEEKELTNKVDDYMLLTCNYKNNTLEYYFKDNMLEKIHETYSVPTSDANYYTLEGEYRQISEKYNNMYGIESIFYTKPNSFEIINDFTLSDIQDIDLENLKVYQYFQFRANSKIVAFEMTSLGYTCG